MTYFPTGLGAVIKAQALGDEPKLFVRTHNGWRDSSDGLWHESNLNLFEVLQEGFVPLPPEPRFGAVVEDATGSFFWRAQSSGARWFCDEGGYYYWHEIDHPVTIHFEGVK